MKLKYTEQALESLREALEFIAPEVPTKKLLEIRDKILTHADRLVKNPYLGKTEEYLDHLGLGHRRIITGHYKIIYRIESGTIYITDIFDSRQDPVKMKG